MVADHRLTAFGVGSSDVKRVSIERAWMGALKTCGFELRMADVGECILVMSLALTKVELAKVNEAARASAAGHAHLVRCCDDVDELLRWAGDASYYSPWFVIESVDID